MDRETTARGGRAELVSGAAAARVGVALVSLLLVTCSSLDLEDHAPWVLDETRNRALPASVRVHRLEDERLPLRAWYVRADLSDPRLTARVLVAQDEERRETVADLAARAGALVAVNAGYFTRDTEVARHRGLLQVEGKLIQETKDADPALGFSAEGEADIAWTYAEEGRVRELDAGTVTPGDRPRPPPRTSSMDWPMHELVQGRPALIFDGAPYGNAIDERHPRTAAGIDAEGNLILMVVDGRQQASRGVSFDELATLMHGVGCVEALNLDGGGSSALVVDGELVNRPSGGTRQREVMSAVALVREP